jgi:pyruvate/2-oxoacid:ferredoxin oxidoreductase beta subunit
MVSQAKWKRPKLLRKETWLLHKGDNILEFIQYCIANWRTETFRTMESLQKEKAKIEANLMALRNSEPKMNDELTRLRAQMPKMKGEIKVLILLNPLLLGKVTCCYICCQSFQDIEGLRSAFDATQAKLSETKHTYIRRRDAMRQQTQSLSVEYENLKKALGSHEVAKEIEETEKRLKHLERYCQIHF